MKLGMRIFYKSGSFRNETNYTLKLNYLSNNICNVIIRSEHYTNNGNHCSVTFDIQMFVIFNEMLRCKNSLLK